MKKCRNHRFGRKWSFSKNDRKLSKIIKMIKIVKNYKKWWKNIKNHDIFLNHAQLFLTIFNHIV